MNKKLVIFALFVITAMSIIISGSIISFARENNGIQITIQKEITFLQNNNLMTDEKKISDLTKLFLMLMREDYRDNAEIDISAIFYSNKNFEKNQKFLKDKIKLQKKLRQKQNQEIIWDNSTISIDNIEVLKDTAKVECFEDYEFILNDYKNGFSSTGTTYNISFQKFDNQWLITEVKSNDEFDTAYYETGFNVDEKINTMLSACIVDNDLNADSLRKELEYQNEKSEKGNNKNLTTQWTRYDYDRHNAWVYALTYSADTRDYSTNSYNPRFGEYASGGLNRDCQNFGSQCVWFGFGGSNNQTAINNKDFPMVSTGSRAWYQTDTRYDTPNTWVWTGVEYFDDYINNGGYQIEGPYGWIYQSNLSYTEAGDIIQVKDSSGTYYHTYVVDQVQGTAGARTTSDIWVSAHTLNRRHNLLSSIFGSNQSNLRNIRIIGYYKP